MSSDIYRGGGGEFKVDIGIDGTEKQSNNKLEEEKALWPVKAFGWTTHFFN